MNVLLLCMMVTVSILAGGKKNEYSNRTYFILRCNYRRILVVTDETTEKGTEESTADVI